MEINQLFIDTIVSTGQSKDLHPSQFKIVDYSDIGIN